jgi:hypothetical protein
MDSSIFHMSSCIYKPYLETFFKTYTLQHAASKLQLTINN